jgi:hypothetical protein
MKKLLKKYCSIINKEYVKNNFKYKFYNDKELEWKFVLLFYYNSKYTLPLKCFNTKEELEDCLKNNKEYFYEQEHLESIKEFQIRMNNLKF